MKNRSEIGTMVMFCLLTLLVAGPVLVRAQEPEPDEAMMVGPDLPLELERKMVEIELRYIRPIAELKADLAVKRFELRRLWLAEKPDSKAILAKAKELEGIRAKLAETRLKQRLEMMELLPIEQRRHFGMGRVGRMRPWARRPMEGMGQNPPGAEPSPKPGPCPGCTGKCHPKGSD
ncbi:MAG: periplasmic heavy metal sensor [candidate division WOR-3 bacterium]